MGMWKEKGESCKKAPNDIPIEWRYWVSGFGIFKLGLEISEVRKDAITDNFTL